MANQENIHTVRVLVNLTGTSEASQVEFLCDLCAEEDHIPDEEKTRVRNQFMLARHKCQYHTPAMRYSRWINSFATSKSNFQCPFVIVHLE